MQILVKDDEGGLIWTGGLETDRKNVHSL